MVDAYAARLLSFGRMDDADYVVVVNEYGQHSIWLSDTSLPTGWRVVGTPAKKSECLNHISALWTDMSPAAVPANDAARR
jgi:MbtH protein